MASSSSGKDAWFSARRSPVRIRSRLRDSLGLCWDRDGRKAPVITDKNSPLLAPSSNGRMVPFQGINDGFESHRGHGEIAQRQSTPLIMERRRDRHPFSLPNQIARRKVKLLKTWGTVPKDAPRGPEGPCCGSQLTLFVVYPLAKLTIWWYRRFR